MKRKHIINMSQQLDNIDNYWASIEGDFNKLNNNLTEGMEQFTERTHQGLERTFKSFDNNLAEISNRLGVTISELDEMLEEMPNTFTRLAGLLEEFNLDREEILNNFAEQNKLFKSEFKGLTSKIEADEKEKLNKIKTIIYKNLKDKLSKDDLSDLESRLSNIQTKVEEDIENLSRKLGEDLSEVKEEILAELIEEVEEDDKQGFLANFRG
ncbi:hypothetical protein MWH25_09320 [Natroniella acetigena]|uniref:hypothetical protein n=1 Tax=Natroniella acetigena TaxID=52004 RepID=UPI002009EE31|nr:hypothetical protein [Natroniella acetigena]MCK8827937.1 hypothetical protein [Natroniella acetigena]